jgi:subtilisin family serine protease
MSVEEGLQRYRALPGVESVDKNYVRRIGGVPNDPSFGSQCGLQNIGQNGGTSGADIHATAAWDLSTGIRDFVVMVIDTGIDYHHQDLADNMWRNAADCYNDGIDHDGNGYINDCYGSR